MKSACSSLHKTRGEEEMNEKLEGTKEGDTVLFHPPAGRVELAVLAVNYR